MMKQLKRKKLLLLIIRKILLNRKNQCYIKDQWYDPLLKNILLFFENMNKMLL